MRRALFTQLLLDGCAIAEAESVSEAEQALLVWDGAFDLLVLDDNLLDGTGWDVLRRLARCAAMATRPGWQQPAVILLACQRPAQCRLDEFHPNAVLIKPFPLRALEQLSVRLLRREAAALELGDAGTVSTPVSRA